MRSRRFQDRQQLESVLGLDVFLRGAEDSDTVGRHVCVRMFTGGPRGPPGPVSRVFGPEDGVCSVLMPPAHAFRAGPSAPGGCWAPGSQSGTRCLLSRHTSGVTRSPVHSAGIRSVCSLSPGPRPPQPWNVLSGLPEVAGSVCTRVRESQRPVRNPDSDWGGFHPV